MPEVSVRQYTDLQVGLQTLAAIGAAEAMPYYMLYTRVRPSMRALERYGISGGIPLMQLWLGERQVGRTQRFHQVLENLHWVDTVGFDGDEYADVGMRDFQSDVVQIGGEPVRHTNQYMTELREAGTTGICYDGTPFYGANHIHGSAADLKSNIIPGTGITEEALRVDLASVRERFDLYETAFGAKIHSPDMIVPGQRGDLLICCHPSLYQTWLEIQKAMLTVGGKSNILVDTFQVMKDPYLKAKNTWYADKISMRTMAPRPFILQDRQAPRFVDKTNFERDERSTG